MLARVYGAGKAVFASNSRAWRTALIAALNDATALRRRDGVTALPRARTFPDLNA
jgi:hypothetical protein